MTENVWIEIGDARHKIHASHLPPVGTKMPVRLEYEGGEAIEVVVLGHDWSIDEPQMERDNPRMRVVIRTRVLPPATRPGSAVDRVPGLTSRSTVIIPPSPVVTPPPPLAVRRSPAVVPAR